MSTVIDELVADAGLSGDESADLSAFLSDLEQLAEVEPPRPSDELAALLAAPPVPHRHRPRLRLVAAAGAAAAVGAMTVTGVAAAASVLPEDAQEFVADLSERLLPSPLHFPRPVPERESAPEPKQTDTQQLEEPDVLVEPPPTQPPFPIPDEGLPSTAPQRTGEMLTLEPSPTPSQDAPPPQTTPPPSPTADATAPPSGSASPSPSDSPAPSGTTEPSTTPEPTPSNDSRLGESPSATPSDGEPEAGEEPATSSDPEPTGSEPRAPKA